jgi:hypothetical protein
MLKEPHFPLFAISAAFFMNLKTNRKRGKKPIATVPFGL